MSKEFPGIKKQAIGIAKMYKWLGLLSIPVLTIVTIISISNVFTRGQLASSDGVQTLWAIIFAAAIEVNVVRLFFEWKLDRDRGALWLGIGLAVVAGVALLIEGLQQSIGFAWSNFYIQIVVGIVVSLRVFVVVFLLAREGAKLGTVLLENQPELQPILSHIPEEFPPTLPSDESVQEPESLDEIEPEMTGNVAEKPSTKGPYFVSFEEASRMTGYAVATLWRQVAKGEIEANKTKDKVKVSSLKYKPGFTAKLPILSLVPPSENEREIS